MKGIDYTRRDSFEIARDVAYNMGAARPHLDFRCRATEIATPLTTQFAAIIKIFQYKLQNTKHTIEIN